MPRRTEYNYNSPTDQHLIRFLGFDPEALLKELAAGKGDGEILQWVLTNAKTPRSPWEIQIWSAYLGKRGPDSDAETLSGFAEYIAQHSKTREDIKTWFDALFWTTLSASAAKHDRGEILCKETSNGKIAVITGGSRGIGAAIAKRLAADGANVAITYTKGADAAARTSRRSNAQA